MSDALRKTIDDFLLERGLAYLRADPVTWVFESEGDSGVWNTQITVVPEYFQVLVYADMRLSVPREQRLDLAEWAARANRGLPVGNFEVDLDEGAVWFKTSIDVEGDALSFALFENLLAANFVTTDTYLGPLKRWLDGEISNVEAVAAAEGMSVDDEVVDDVEPA
jgi:hypothetical protein